MAWLVIVSTTLVASVLSLFSGFGLGTILLPAFILFFPIDLAVAATAAVHAANGLFKVLQFRQHINWRIMTRFGLPAIFMAVPGAALLGLISHTQPLFSYSLLHIEAQVTPTKLLLGVLITTFALFEVIPRLNRLSFDEKFLPLGGVLSGFFGGLSGHQGALRAAFLAKSHISPRAFVATSSAIGLMVDALRLPAYAIIIFKFNSTDSIPPQTGKLVLLGICTAFLGVMIGKRLIHKVTMKTIQYITGSLLLLSGALLIFGII